MKTIVFVGDSPSPRMKPGADPFKGAACEFRLKEWIDFVVAKQYPIAVINQRDYLWVNFYVMVIRDNCLLVALGNNASKALQDIPHFKLPHPSDRNRQINDEKFILERLNACKAFIDDNQR